LYFFRRLCALLLGIIEGGVCFGMLPPAALAAAMFPNLLNPVPPEGMGKAG
jgi:hypothetical protein